MMAMVDIVELVPNHSAVGVRIKVNLPDQGIDMVETLQMIPISMAQ